MLTFYISGGRWLQLRFQNTGCHEQDFKEEMNELYSQTTVWPRFESFHLLKLEHSLWFPWLNTICSVSRCLWPVEFWSSKSPFWEERMSLHLFNKWHFMVIKPLTHILELLTKLSVQLCHYVQNTHTNIQYASLWGNKPTSGAPTGDLWNSQVNLNTAGRVCLFNTAPIYLKGLYSLWSPVLHTCSRSHVSAHTLRCWETLPVPCSAPKDDVQDSVWVSSSTSHACTLEAFAFCMCSGKERKNEQFQMFNLL